MWRSQQSGPKIIKGVIGKLKKAIEKGSTTPTDRSFGIKVQTGQASNRLKLVQKWQPLEERWLLWKKDWGRFQPK